MNINTFATVVTYVSTAVAWLFIILYHLVTRGYWAATQMGRHLMAIVAVDAGIFTMLTAAHLWPWLALQVWFQWTYVFVVFGIAIVTAWRGYLLVRANYPRKGI